MSSKTLGRNPIQDNLQFIVLIGTDDGNLLDTLWHDDFLSPGDEYTSTTQVQINNRLSGNFFIHVLTDVFNSVYEHTNENDNAGVSEV